MPEEFTEPHELTGLAETEHRHFEAALRISGIPPDLPAVKKGSAEHFEEFQRQYVKNLMSSF